MAVTNFSPLLGLALPTTGDLSGTWGVTVNDAITSLIDSAVAGTTTLSADADVTLSTTNGVANQARNAIILWTASNGATTRYVTAPAQSKAYVVINSGTGTVVIRGSGPTTGVSVASGFKALVAWNGSDFVKVNSAPISLTTDVTGILPAANGGTGLSAPGTVGNILTSTGSAWVSSPASGGGSGTVTSVSGTGTVNGISLSGSVTTSGSLTLGGTLSGVSLTSQVSGTLPVANGGTGTTTPNLVQGTNVTITGTWPNQTINSSGGASNFQTFTTSGTWTKPAGYAATSRVLIECWGGGGSGCANTTAGVGGGGGGAYNYRWVALSSLGSTETVTIGAGGTGVAVATTGSNAGGTTSFGSVTYAYGGGGGASGNYSVAYGGGGGGQTSAGASTLGLPGGPGFPYSIGTGLQAYYPEGFGYGSGGGGGGIGVGPGTSANYKGGGGGGSFGDTCGFVQYNSNGGISVWGGGGGGGIGSSGNVSGWAGSQTGAGGTSQYGGNGGAGSNSGSGTAGTQPGGGGGASRGSGASSGAGGAGQVQITVFAGA
jgi:hypothetical protein